MTFFFQCRAEGDPTEDPEQEAQQADAGVRQRGIRGAGLGIPYTYSVD